MEVPFLLGPRTSGPYTLADGSPCTPVNKISLPAKLLSPLASLVLYECILVVTPDLQPRLLENIYLQLQLIAVTLQNSGSTAWKCEGVNVNTSATTSRKITQS